jgi:hypothetical protein
MKHTNTLALTSALWAIFVACSSGDDASKSTGTDAGPGGDGGVTTTDGGKPLADAGAGGSDGGNTMTDAGGGSDGGGCPVDGCVFATGAQAVFLAADGAYVYWLSPTGVSRVGVSGGTPAPIAPLGAGQTFANGFALTGSNLFWTTGGAALSSGLVQRVLVDGGSLTPLTPATQDGLSVASDGTSAFWQDLAGLKKSNPDGGTPFLLQAGTLSAVTLNGGFVYWGGVTSIMKTPVGGSGGAAVTGASVSGEIAIAADATNVYYLSQGNLSKIAVGGGTPAQLATVGASNGNAFAIAIDATNVYYANGVGGSTGKVSKVPIATGTPVTLASMIAGLGSSIAVDGTNVYFISGNDIHSVPK